MASDAILPDQGINLAHVAPFRLGEVEVYPATRQLIRRQRRETLEPRVMQVLVALAVAKGDVLTRDELIERCWEGRIVSENAINRVISRLRQISSDFGMNSFQLETITKVGYRMVVLDEPVLDESPDGHSSAPDSPLEAAPISRRGMIAAGLVGTAALSAVTGWFLWRRDREYRPSPEALELFRRGERAQREGLAGQPQQAVSFYEQAVAADPNYAQAWGALALSYRHILEGYGKGDERSLPQLIESAASRALALDPDNADAQLALLITKPFYRNWEPMEAGLKRLAGPHPNHWMVQAQLGLLLHDVGRFDEGIRHSQRVLELDPFLPVGYALLTRALSCARRIQEADALLDRALTRWPAHPLLWNARYNVYLFSDRPGSAAAFVSNPEKRPEEFGPETVVRRQQLARAVEAGAREDVEASLKHYRQVANSDVASSPIAAAMFALLDRPDLAFSSLERYYFGTGGFGSPARPPGPFDRRYGIALFAPPLARYREDPRYKALLERTGLEHYWRSTGTLPDFRRA